MSFSSDVSNFCTNAMDEADRKRRAISIALFASVIKDTPVDTGRARGNWQTSVGSPKVGEIDRTGASVSTAEAVSEVQSTRGRFDNDIYMTNNLPYIERLEYGYSKKAPEGMVRKNILRINSIIRRA